MDYRFVWADGELELGSAYSRQEHHYKLLERIVERLGHPPQNWAGGMYLENNFQSGPATISITWEQGTHPTEDELRFLIQQSLHIHNDRETAYRLAVLEERSAMRAYPDSLPSLSPGQTPLGWKWAYDADKDELWIVKSTGEYFHVDILGNIFGMGWWEEEEFSKMNVTFGDLEADGTLIVYKGGDDGLDGEALVDRIVAEARRMDIPVRKVMVYDSDNWDAEPEIRPVARSSEDTEEEYNFGFMKEPHGTLYPPFFDGEKPRAEAVKVLKNYVLNEIEKELPNPDNWITFTVFGSGISYMWDETGDFDIQMYVDADKFNEQSGQALTADELVSRVREIVGPINFPSFKELNLEGEGAEGTMLIQYYPKPGKGTKEENLAQKPYACLNLDTGEWYQRPEDINPEFYGHLFIKTIDKAEEMAVQAEAALAELERNTVNWQFWTQMHSKYGDKAYKDEAEKSRESAEANKASVDTMFDAIFGGRSRAYSPEGEGIRDERDILQKVLEVWGIFQRLKHFARQPLPWEEQELPKETNDSMVRTANWTEIMEKATRLRNEGKVGLERNAPNNIVGTVQGDHGTYRTEIWRDDPNGNAITLWDCECPWSDYSWGRTRQWKKFEGRPCAHTLALFWEAQASPMEGEAGTGGLPIPEQQPPVPGAPLPVSIAPIPGGPNVPIAPTPAPVEMQPPMEAPLPAPAPPPQPPAQSVITEPGQGGTIHIPGTFSKLKIANPVQQVLDQYQGERLGKLRFVEAKSFENGSLIRTKVDLEGLDRDGIRRVVPKNRTGEVIYSDDDTTIAIFPLNTGELQPHLVRVQGDTGMFFQAPARVKNPFIGPAR